MALPGKPGKGKKLGKAMPGASKRAKKVLDVLGMVPGQPRYGNLRLVHGKPKRLAPGPTPWHRLPKAITLGMLDAAMVGFGGFAVDYVDKRLRGRTEAVRDMSDLATAITVQAGIAVAFGFLYDFGFGESEFSRLIAAGGFSVPTDTLLRHLRVQMGIAVAPGEPWWRA